MGYTLKQQIEETTAFNPDLVTEYIETGNEEILIRLVFDIIKNLEQDRTNPKIASEELQQYIESNQNY